MLPHIKKRDKIKAFRQALEDGNLIGPSLSKAHITAMQYQRWRKESNFDRFARFVEACRLRGQGRRDDMVEDAQFKRLVSQKASGNEYEFYLCNRQPERWKKLKDNSIVVKTDVTVENNPSGDNNTFAGEDAELVSNIRAKLFPEINPK